jgi:hypothetical protein
VATVSKRWLSVRDIYAVDVASDEDDLLVLASVLRWTWPRIASASSTERSRAERSCDDRAMATGRNSQDLWIGVPR